MIMRFISHWACADHVPEFLGHDISGGLGLYFRWLSVIFHAWESLFPMAKCYVLWVSLIVLLWLNSPWKLPSVFACVRKRNLLNCSGSKFSHLGLIHVGKTCVCSWGIKFRIWDLFLQLGSIALNTSVSDQSEYLFFI